MLILDRVEENIAYINMEDGSMCADAALLAPGVKEGDVLIFEDEGRGYIKPVEDFVTIDEAIADLSNIRDLGG